MLQYIAKLFRKQKEPAEYCERGQYFEHDGDLFMKAHDLNHEYNRDVYVLLGGSYNVLEERDFDYDTSKLKPYDIVKDKKGLFEKHMRLHPKTQYQKLGFACNDVILFQVTENGFRMNGIGELMNGKWLSPRLEIVDGSVNETTIRIVNSEDVLDTLDLENENTVRDYLRYRHRAPDWLYNQQYSDFRVQESYKQVINTKK